MDSGCLDQFVSSHDTILSVPWIAIHKVHKQPLGLIMYPSNVEYNKLYSIGEFYSPLTDTKPNKVNLTNLKTPTIKQEMLSCLLLQVGSSTKISITCMCFSIFTSCFRFLFSIQTRFCASLQRDLVEPFFSSSGQKLFFTLQCALPSSKTI